jgi:hypothetical protein
MLSGQAKTDYQKEYMRRRRAGLGKPPMAERESGELTEAELRSAEKLVQFGKEIRLAFRDEPITGATEEEIRDHAQKSREWRRERREHRRELRNKAAAGKAEWQARMDRQALLFAEIDAHKNGWGFSPWPKPIFHCVFCDKTSDETRMAGDHVTHVCRDCARELVRVCESSQSPGLTEMTARRARWSNQTKVAKGTAQ